MAKQRSLLGFKGKKRPPDRRKKWPLDTQFRDIHLTRNAKGELKIRMKLRIGLDRDRAKLFPSVIRNAFSAIRNPKKAIKEIGLADLAQLQTVDFFSVPDVKDPSVHLPAAKVLQIFLFVADSTEVQVEFEVDADFSKTLWDWIGHSFKHTVFVTMAQAQRELGL